MRRDSGLALAVHDAENCGVAVWIVALVVASAVVVGCGAHESTPRPHQSATSQQTAPTSGPGRLVAIGGGRSLYLHCAGAGTPTVVLEAGLSGNHDVWNAVQPQVARTTMTCAYDRAGLGSSLPMPGVHDAGDEIADLARLLEHAHVRAPYVLVGHSYGGLLVRLFARAHPDLVAGVVLVDAMGRDQTRRQLAAWPTGQAPARRREWAQPVIDGLDLRSSEALASGIRSLPGGPLVVITAGRRDPAWTDLPRGLIHSQERLRRRMQDELATLSPDHAHVVALRSSHFVQRSDGQPGVVIGAVRAVVEAARSHTDLPSCRRLFRGPAVRCRS